MAKILQYSTTLRNNQLNQIETTIGTFPVMQWYTGAAPSDIASEPSGTRLLSFSLPSDWLSAAANGVKSMLGTWATTATADGLPGYFRVYNSSFSVASIQGSVGPAVDDPDMVWEDGALVTGQGILFTGFTLTSANGPQ